MNSNLARKHDGELSKPDLCMANEKKAQKVDQDEEKDSIYAYNFFEKVEETLLAENQHSQYESFLEILQSFNEHEDQVTDLYYKIENLLGADHPELVDLFLTFLLPGQAAEVGKFFEHFILTKANDFLNKLNIYFAKQPSQIKKIYSCLNDLSNEVDVTMEQIKSRILPLLKGNPLLIEWFLQLFPPEKPPDCSLSDYEVISMKKLPLPDYSDPNQIFEDVLFVEVPNESTNENTLCGTKYIQGRIVQGMQPARLSFLAHDNAVPVQCKDISSPKGCVHYIRNTDKTKTNADGEEKDQDNNTSDELQEPRFKLCDDMTFKAHAIRLNPLVHGGKGIGYADVAHLLMSESDMSLDGNPCSEEDKPTSPKKQQNKTITKKRINSPVNKKSTISGKHSPTAGKKAIMSVPADSKVIAVSKKLKSIIDSPAPESSLDVGSQPSVQSGTKRKTASAAPNPSNPLLKKDKQLKRSLSDEQVSEEKSDATEPKEATSQSNWTRDEDKVILEEIKNGYSTVDELITRISEKIEGRNAAEITARHDFLMEVLKKFQKTN